MRLFLLLALLLLPPAGLAQDLPEPGETRTYKGVELVGTAFPDRKNDDFFRIGRIAIDLLGRLPRANWNQSGLIRRIIYNPPSKHREATHLDNLPGGVFPGRPVRLAGAGRPVPQRQVHLGRRSRPGHCLGRHLRRRPPPHD
jgi:hypothetical protein